MTSKKPGEVLESSLSRFFGTEYQGYLQKLDQNENNQAQLLIHPFIQKFMVEQICRNLSLQVISQWSWRSPSDNFIFDLKVEPNLVIECRLTERKKCADAKHWLKSGVVLIEQQFKTLKLYEPQMYVVIFIEAVYCHPEDLRLAILPLLDNTDQLITSIQEFEEFVYQWRCQVQGSGPHSE